MDHLDSARRVVVLHQTFLYLGPQFDCLLNLSDSAIDLETVVQKHGDVDLRISRVLKCRVSIKQEWNVPKASHLEYKANLVRATARRLTRPT